MIIQLFKLPLLARMPKSYECCGFSFEEYSAYRTHRRNIHKAKPPAPAERSGRKAKVDAFLGTPVTDKTCPRCLKQFASLEGVYRHVYEQYVSSGWQCPVCLRTFSRRCQHSCAQQDQGV